MPKPLNDFERGLIVGLMLAKVSVSQTENILKENNMVGTQRTIQRVFKQWQVKDFDEFKKLINDTFLNDADIKKLIRTSISNIKSSLEKLIELKGDAII